MNMIRYFSSVSKGNIKNSLLAQLREKTGCSVMNCRKALQLHNNDITKAEEWLKAEAVKMGWEKAMKLRNRIASEGLVAAIKAKNKVVMVEVNCETDFVARNEKFQSLVEVVTRTCVMHPIHQEDNTGVRKVLLKEEELGNLLSPDKKKLNDYVASAIGTLGEKIILKRAFCCEGNEDIELDVGVHPKSTDNEGGLLFGKYAAYVALQRFRGDLDPDVGLSKNLGADLCTHVIGLNPQEIGDSVEEIPKNVTEDEDEDENENENENENVLLKQQFVKNPSITVGELLNQYGAKVLDFHRIVCGEEEVETDVTQKNTERINNL